MMDFIEPKTLHPNVSENTNLSFHKKELIGEK